MAKSQSVEVIAMNDIRWYGMSRRSESERVRGRRRKKGRLRNDQAYGVKEKVGECIISVYDDGWLQYFKWIRLIL